MKKNEAAPLRVVVAGGTRGIGLSTTRRFRDEGAQVVAVARTPSPVPRGVELVITDLATPAGAEVVAESVGDLMGGLDVLVDNVGAGTRLSSDPLTASEEDWAFNLETNLLATVRLDRALVPLMVRQQHGVVIHVSSVISRLVQVDNAPYSAAKAALDAYSKALSLAVGPQGVRVCGVSPGAIATGGHGFAETAERTGRTEADVRRDFERALGAPLGRMGEAHEVADLIAFLASPAASYLTGVRVSIDGGLLPVTA